MHLLAEGRTEVIEGFEESTFYVGNFKDPIAMMQVKDIPDYINEAFWSGYEIWNRGRLTNSLPISPVWGDNPEHLIDLITAFQSAYEQIVRR